MIRKQVGSDKMRYNIKRSENNEFKVVITDELEVAIYVPLDAKKNEISEFLRSHKNEINLKRQKCEDTKHMVLEQRRQMYNENRLNPVETNETGNIMTKTMAKEAYAKAEDVLDEKVQKVADKLKLEYNGIKISRANKSWGSCSKNQCLYFSYRLVFLPEHLIEYVIIHQMVHLTFPIHGENYSKLLETYCSNYKVLELELKEYEAKVPQVVGAELC